MQTPAFKPSLLSPLPPCPAEQHPGSEGRLKPPHVGCQLHQKQVGDAGQLPRQSGERGAPQPPKWVLILFSPPTLPDWPCSTGMGTLWITSASPSSTTSSRASSTSMPPAKHQRSCSETALVSRLPTALCHSSLSLSVCASISLPTPLPPARVCLSPPAPKLHRAAMSRESQHGPKENGFVCFFREPPSPSHMGRKGGTQKRVALTPPSQHVTGKWSHWSVLPACSEQGLPLLHHLRVLKLNKSRWTFFFLNSFNVSHLDLSP